MSRLFTFGCSLMYGADHKSTKNNTRPSNEAYTNLVADHYNLKHYHFSVNGHSNQDIARQVFIATKFQEENNLNPIYWIGWTKYKHLGLTHPIGKNKTRDWPHVRVHNELIKDSKDEDLHKWAKDVYKVVDKMSRFVLSVNTVLQVNSFLKMKGLEAINSFNSATWKTECTPSNYFIKNTKEPIENLLEDWVEQKTKKFDKDYRYVTRGMIVGKSGNSYKTFDPYLESLWQEIKKFKWFEWGIDDLGFQMWCRDNDLGMYPEKTQNISTWHPDEKAHQEAAKKIINSSIMGDILK